MLSQERSKQGLKPAGKQVVVETLQSVSASNIAMASWATHLDAVRSLENDPMKNYLAASS